MTSSTENLRSRMRKQAVFSSLNCRDRVPDEVELEGRAAREIKWRKMCRDKSDRPPARKKSLRRGGKQKPVTVPTMPWEE